MYQMIDSHHQLLNSADIVTIALKNTNSPYPVNVAYPAILSEMSQPNTKVKQIGNTIFVVHLGDKGQGFFKALNADTAKNFVSNSKAFCIWAKKELGLSLLVTQFKNQELQNLFKLIAKNPPMQGMGYNAFHMQSGDTRILLNLGN